MRWSILIIFILFLIVFCMSPSSASDIYVDEINSLFSIGDTVEVINALNVGIAIRDNPAGNSLLSPRFNGDQGVIRDGPVDAALNGVTFTWWKIKWNNDGKEGWSAEKYPGGVYYLQKVITATPNPPSALSPGTSTEPGVQINTLTPTLQWQASVGGADYYALAISKYPYGSSNTVVNPQRIYGTSWAVPSGILTNGEKYRWNMQAIKGGVESSISNTLYFNTLDTTPPTISITSPYSYQNFGTPTITVTGTASDNVGVSKVEVKVGSGSWQTASGTTSWSRSVTLASDSNTLTARATDISGNNKETSITVTYTITPTTGSISVTSTPTGASVYLDGSYQGSSPMTIPSVNTGSHFIKLTKSGYQDWTTSVSVVAGQTTQINAQMSVVQPTTGSISVTSTPTGASVYLDDSYQGSSPMTIPSVSTGSHSVKLTKSGYRDWSTSVSVVAGQTTQVNAQMNAEFSDYNTQKAVDYADEWWNKINPNYEYYNNNDCANFVSQSLIAGGLILDQYIDSKGSIPYCDNLDAWLKSKGYQNQEFLKSQQPKEPIWFLPGDVAIFGDATDKYRHAVIAVTGDSNNYATVNAHTVDQYHKPIQFFYDNSNWDRCTFYHIPGIPSDYPNANWAPANSNNYQSSNRPSSSPIEYVIIHVAQGSYAGSISWFQDSAAGVSAHYVIRSSDGEVTQMVKNKDIAYHAGNWDFNTKSIGIEHEGWVDQPAYFTDQMYRSSADLTRYICNLYDIPMDRDHIIGHNEVPGATHTDPGASWNWDYYMRLVTESTATDTTPPTVNAFDVTPKSGLSSTQFTISYTISDTGGSGLKQVELWSATDTNGDGEPDWPATPPHNPEPVSGNGPISGSFFDTPPSSITGNYWYGVHVVDNHGNWNDERNSNSGGLPGVYGPIKVTLTESDNTLPTVSITSPSNNQSFNTATITVTGTASDNVGVNKVEVKVGSDSWETATGTDSWSQTVTLLLGSNTLTARATDMSGNTKESSVTVTYMEPDTMPSVSTSMTTNVGSNQATLNGQLSSMGGASSCTVYFEYGTTTAYGSTTSSQSMGSTGSFSQSVSSLSPGTTYYYRAVATNSAGTEYGTAQFFTTPSPNPPSDEYEFIAKWGSFGTGDGQFNWPFGVAVDSTGNVYIADTENHRIQKFTSSGAFITEWGTSGTGSGQFNSPQGVAVDSAGIVYVSDTNNNRIQKFTPEGNFITKWGSSGTNDGQLAIPFGVAVDSTGNVYIADSNNNRIQKFTPDGNFITKWGISGTGDGQFNWPFGVAVDSTGNVYVAEVNNNRIQKFTSSGAFITKWGTEGTGDRQFNTPWGVAVGATGNVYVVDTNNHRIQKFTPDGNFITKWGTWGTADGQFSVPSGVAVDAAGNVYVSETNNNRIQKFRSTSPTPPPSPIAAFTATPTTGTAPLIVQFTDQSINTPTSWKWEYSTGGGWTQFSTSKNPSYQFTSSGNYSIRLTVTNAGGSSPETKMGYIFVDSKNPAAQPIPITITSGTNEQILTFGTDLDGTDGFDTGLDMPAPPSKPSAVFEAIFAISDPLFPRLYTDIRGEIDEANPERTWQMEVISKDADAVLSWDPILLPEDLTCTLTYAGTRYDMNSVATITVPRAADGTVQRVAINISSGMEMAIPLAAGWNLVSVPYADAEFTLTSPNSIQVVYAYNPTTRAYVISQLDQMQPGKAYWVASTSATEITVTGTPVSPITTNLNAGWNLIGGMKQNVAFSNIAIDPAGSWAMPFIYGYNAGTRAYETTTTLQPGHGYWGAVMADCTIMIPAGGPSPQPPI